MPSATRSRPASTPAPSPRGEARREHIAAAALAVIARVGADALTHRLVAAEAGLPLAATTYWFSSKEELIRVAFEHAVERDVASLAAQVASAEPWTRETVAERLAQGIVRLRAEQRTSTVLDYSLCIEAARRPELHPIAERWSGAYLRFHTDLLQALDPTATEDDARLVGAALDGLLLDQLTSEHPLGERRLTALVERLLAAFLDRPPR